MYLCVTLDFLWDVIIYGQDPLNTSVGSIVFSFFILTGKIIFQGSLPSHSVEKYFHSALTVPNFDVDPVHTAVCEPNCV